MARREKVLAAFAGVLMAGSTLMACADSGGNQANGATAATESAVKVTARPFGALPDGREVTLFEIRNENGAGMTLMDLGATILTLDVPDRDGALADVVLGFETAPPYLTDSPYFGAVVGRYANRIDEGRFTLGGETYQLPINNGPNSLHGGLVGFDKRMWQGEIVETGNGPGVRFTMTSPDGDQGYPGEMDVTVTYAFNDRNELTVDYAATTSEPTVVNLSQHSYFNLAGQASGSVLDHVLRINADATTPVDDTLIPTGEIAPVEGTPFDFRQPKPIGRDIGVDNVQLTHGGGYDHNWVLNGTGMRAAAELTDPKSGRRMTILTDQPGLQFYSGNFLDGTVSGKGGFSYPYRGAVALETQHFPDTPNQPNFPSTRLAPGETFNSRTVFRFSTVE